MENVLVNFYGGGVITHQDQEQNGLSFQVSPLDNGQIVVKVNGSQAEITDWIDRVVGSIITNEEAVVLVDATEERGLEVSIPNQEAELNGKKARLAELKDKGKL